MFCFCKKLITEVAVCFNILKLCKSCKTVKHFCYFENHVALSCVSLILKSFVRCFSLFRKNAHLWLFVTQEHNKNDTKSC